MKNAKGELVWTRELPTVAGWYFYRSKLHTSGQTTVVQAFRGNGTQIDTLLINGVIRYIDDTALFAGPIQEPVEGQEV